MKLSLALVLLPFRGACFLGACCFGACFLGACSADPVADADPKKTTSRPAEETPDKPKPAATNIGHVDGAGAAKLIAETKDIVILDVRTPAEFKEGHLKGAINIDFKAEDFREKLGTLDKTKKYLMHCRSGGRSTNALPIFKELGFADIVHLDGGFLDWQKAGQPVEK